MPSKHYKKIIENIIEGLPKDLEKRKPNRKHTIRRIRRVYINLPKTKQNPN